MKSTFAVALCFISTLSFFACGGSQPSETTTTAEQTSANRSRALEGAGGESHSFCDATQQGREVSEYDTSGDDLPDVRRVFKRMGEDGYTRLVMICRESDLNADGRKDVVRYYNDEGRPIREESDRNFDGQMDTVFFFQEGKVVRQEVDESGDGRVDTKIYYDKGAPIRAERDTRSNASGTFVTTQFEYYEGGRTVRVGTDFDADGKVDRWDRDTEWSERQRLALEDNSPPSD